MHVPLAIVTVALLAATGCSPSQVGPMQAPPSDDAIADSVGRVWETINAAWGRGDTTALSPLIAAEYTIVAASGRVLDRAELLGYIHRNATGTAGGISTRDHRALVLGAARDVVMHTAEVTDYVEAAGGRDTVITRATDVFEHRGGRWVLVGSHESFVRSPRGYPSD